MTINCVPGQNSARFKLHEIYNDVCVKILIYQVFLLRVKCLRKRSKFFFSSFEDRMFFFLNCALTFLDLGKSCDCDVYFLTVMIELEVMWMSLISTLIFMNDGWFIEMVQADVTVDEISCQQNLFPRLFSRKT